MKPLLPSTALLLLACSTHAPAERSTSVESGALEVARPARWVTGDRGFPCGDGETEGPVERLAAKNGTFTVSVAGPSGSGHYWTAQVALPARSGFCLSTSTVGWRHVGGTRPLALRLAPLIRWVQDVDGDGVDELVVPTSIPLRPESSLSDYVVSVTVYDYGPQRFSPNASKTRALEERIARAYYDASRRTDVPAATRDHFRRAAVLLRREG